ncbi:MAG: class I SAM-dependent methyltransferase [Deltaproteobacteria bacterium]|nr:class I SAM-dependent methyltransferase [Deltaproteobacteria bacterium]
MTTRTFRGVLGALAIASAGCGAATPPASPEAAPMAKHDHHDHDHQHHEHHGHGGMAEMPHRFEHAEDWVGAFDDPARDAWQKPDEVVAAMAIAPGMTVADIGAGTGYFEGRLSAAVGAKGAVIATDLEPDMIRYITERAHKAGWANITAQLGGATDPGLAAASVDRILIVDVWHHLADRVAFARGLAAALRPGGQVIVVDFELTSDRGPPKEHKLAATAIASDLAAAGLVTSMASESLPDQYIVVARAK